MANLTLLEKYPLLTMEVTNMAEKQMELETPGMSNAQRQSNYKARLRDLAARGEAALHLINEMEGLALQLAWKGDPLGKELVSMAEGNGLAGIVRSLHKRRQNMANAIVHEHTNAHGVKMTFQTTPQDVNLTGSPVTSKTRKTPSKAQRSPQRGAKGKLVAPPSG